ncbi:hypothetical protein [Pseudomonas abieticivorans]|uniref:hypothetical protein n=1 Tax=Pseudomonas abieticivorans TaxID=2931382 RepID=UPI0020BDCE90|nr:hypothetical protein [Pseudomonas sp. PIA16]
MGGIAAWRLLGRGLLPDQRFEGFIPLLIRLARETGMPASSERTCQWLDWTPTGPGLLEDIDQPGYFAAL